MLTDSVVSVSSMKADSVSSMEIVSSVLVTSSLDSIISAVSVGIVEASPDGSSSAGCLLLLLSFSEDESASSISEPTFSSTAGISTFSVSGLTSVDIVLTGSPSVLISAATTVIKRSAIPVLIINTVKKILSIRIHFPVVLFIKISSPLD